MNAAAVCWFVYADRLDQTTSVIPLTVHKPPRNGQPPVYWNDEKKLFVKLRTTTTDEYDVVEGLLRRHVTCITALDGTALGTVVTFDGLCETRIPALVLPAVPGIPLTLELAKNPSVLAAALEAFREINLAGVSHLDVKFEHMFLSDSLTGARIFVIDFGQSLFRQALPSSGRFIAEFRGNYRTASLFQYFGDIANQFADVQSLCFLLCAACFENKVPWMQVQQRHYEAMCFDAVVAKMRVLFCGFAPDIASNPWMQLAKTILTSCVENGALDTTFDMAIQLARHEPLSTRTVDHLSIGFVAPRSQVVFASLVGVIGVEEKTEPQLLSSATASRLLSILGTPIATVYPSLSENERLLYEHASSLSLGHSFQRLNSRLCELCKASTLESFLLQTHHPLNIIALLIVADATQAHAIFQNNHLEHPFLTALYALGRFAIVNN